MSLRTTETCALGRNLKTGDRRRDRKDARRIFSPPTSKRDPARGRRRRMRPFGRPLHARCSSIGRRHTAYVIGARTQNKTTSSYIIEIAIQLLMAPRRRGLEVRVLINIRDGWSAAVDFIAHPLANWTTTAWMTRTTRPQPSRPCAAQSSLQPNISA